MRTSFRAAFALFLTLAVAACGDAPPGGKQAAGDSAPVQKQEGGADAELTSRVEQALAGAAAPSAAVEVQSNDGVVLLKGRVASDEEKKRIMAAVQQVQGVKWVQNQVAVIPPAASPPASTGSGRSGARGP